MLTRPGGVSAQHVANVYQIDEDDARDLLAWVQKACRMHDELTAAGHSVSGGANGVPL